MILKGKRVIHTQGVDQCQRRKLLMLRGRRVHHPLRADQGHQVTSHVVTLKVDSHGPTPGAEKVRENQSQDLVLKNQYRTKSPDQGHDQETSHPGENQSQGRIQGDGTINSRSLNPDHTLVLTASQGPGHLDEKDHDHLDEKDHALDLGGNLLYLGISEGFLLSGKEVLALSSKGHVQEEGVLQRGDFHVPDLIQEGKEVARDLAQGLREESRILDQGHVYEVGDLDLCLGEGETDLGQGPALTREDKVEGQHPETEKEVRVKADRGPSQNQKKRLSLIALYQFPILTQHWETICLTILTSQWRPICLCSR